MSTTGLWPEIQQAKKEKRYELVLSGSAISQKIEDNGLDSGIYGLNSLNFLEISRTSLTIIAEDIGKLTNLTSLVLCANRIEILPESVGQLRKLKLLDISNNKLEEIPNSLENLTDLQTLNLNNNQLKSLPSLTKLINLAVLNVSKNVLETFPDVCSPDMQHLSSFKANGNRISLMPSTICMLSSLKSLDLSENLLEQLPGELGECSKLKELNLSDNKIKDNRLAKLINQCHVKSVLDYIKSHCPKTKVESAQVDKGKAKKGKRGKKGGGSGEALSDSTKNTITAIRFPDDGLRVIVTPTIKEVRPFIVCCILKNVNLTQGIQFKKFISIQNELHEDVCQKRTVATIATHDMKQIKGKLLYDARSPDKIKLVPLGRLKEVSASDLMEELRQEAEAVRKEKKRNVYTGVHKYLYLLNDKTVYPCLLDGDSHMISFPPITNCDQTKISPTSRDILVEVTSSTDLNICKKVLNVMIEKIIVLGIGNQSGQAVEDTNESSSVNSLTVEQVRIEDPDGNLKAVYPSRTDLNPETLEIIWDNP